ncbi:VOC family protein [Arthrobacter pigmenti]
MSSERATPATPAAPQGYNTVNPFIITLDAPAMMGFLKEVFGAEEVPQARTLDHDGLILHSELKIGDSTVMVAARKPDWPFTPSLLQVYVDDLDAALELAHKRGGNVVTKPTDFYGTQFARILDPWHNLWWIWQHGDEPSWETDGTAQPDWTGEDDSDESWSQDSPELTHIHDTLLTTMHELKDPRNRG